MDLIQIFKDTMRNTGNTSESIAKLCNLNKYSVDNILQKRSNRFDYIVKIAEALDIPIFSTSYQSIENKITIKTELYTISLNIISKILAKKKNMIVSRQVLQDCIYKVYMYIANNPDQTNLYSAYAQGIIDNLKTLNS